LVRRPTTGRSAVEEGTTVGFSVITNTVAMNAHRSLSTTSDAMTTSLERLSSGYRINQAADDAAGLAISEGLRSQIGGMTQAVRNSQDAVSVVQTAEGALGTTTAILQRMRDLSVHAANAGALNEDATAAIQKEIGQLKAELTRIADTTTFNGTKLLDGSYAGVFQVGAEAGQTIEVGIGTEMGARGLGVLGVDVTGSGQVDVQVVAAKAEPDQNGVMNLYVGGLVLVGATDWAGGITEQRGTISLGGTTLDLGSVVYTDPDGNGAVDNAEALVQLNAAARSAGFTYAHDPFVDDGDDLIFRGDVPAGTAPADLTAATPSFTPSSAAPHPHRAASKAIVAIDAALERVSSQRADLGALQNRLEHTVDNLTVSIENTTASESRIRDTDMAAEMSRFSRSQVLTQAGTAMLAQANQSTQGILKLLG
jgi:flagellin